MHRKLLVAPLVLLGLVAGPVAADYLLIRINLDKINLPVLPPSATQPAGMAGFGAGGFGGGMRGQMPGGAGMAGFGAVGGFPGAGGPMQGGMRGGQRGGMRGGQRGGQPGNAGNPGQGAAGPNAAQRALGKKRPRNKQNPAPQNPQTPPNPQDPMTPAEEPEFDPSSPWVAAFIEFKVKFGSPKDPVAEVEIPRYGSKTILPLHASLKGDLHFLGFRGESFGDHFRTKLKKHVKDKKIEDVLILVDWALAHGLVKTKDFQHALDDLVKLDPKHPVVKNLERVRDMIKKPFPDSDPDVKALIAEVQKDGFRPKFGPLGHYVLLTNLPPTPQTDAILTRRLVQLEEALENFYYWFALQKDLPLPAFPQSRLPAVLLSSPQEFYSRHVAWGAPALADDGFTPRRENVVILSGRRLDEDYNSLAKQTDAIIQKLGLSHDELLTGNVWHNKNRLLNAQGGPDQQKAANFVYAQTLNLLQRSMEDESERAASTHEATRQLLIESGLFPRHVQVPEWVLAGLASYFETPVGAVYHGVGLPSWSHLIALKHYRDAGKFAKAPEVLFNVLTDRYFETAERSTNIWQANKESEQLAEAAHEDGEIARCTAWALVYYLAQNRKLGNLLRYGQELNQMPRDLDLDEKALQGCFARAFDLTDAKDGRLDPAKLQYFADAWFSEMQSVNLELAEVEQLYMDLRNQQTDPPAAASPDKQ
jgi:hypothetical protein